MTLIAAVAMVMTGCSKPDAPKQVFLDPALAPLVPNDTTVMVGARIDKLAKTPAFDTFSQFRAVEDFAVQSGIDPATRLYQLIFASNGKRGVVLGRGKFTNGIIAPDLARKGAAESHYKGMAMYGDEKESMLFLNASTALLGETSLVKAVADQEHTGTLSAKIAGLLPGIPYEAQVWGVYGGGDVDVKLPGNLANLQNVLKMLDSGMFYVTVDTPARDAQSPDTKANATKAYDTKAHVTAVGTARTEESARDLKGALQALMALGKIAGDVQQNGTQVRVKADLGL
ncbi:MAG: hypothetical protein ABL995_12055 [Bryobacteraceae bacterium]